MGKDQLIGPLKSALQKEIRRGHVAEAAAVAAELMHRDRDALARRLTVIAPEDVDWRLLPVVGRAAQAAMTDPDGWLNDPQPDLVQVAAAMAARVKDKEAWWLPATVWGERYPTPSHLSIAELADALAAGDHRRALSICFASMDRRQLLGPAGIIVAVQEAASASEPAREIVEWAIWRAKLGGLGVGECIAAAVLAAIDLPEHQTRLELVEWEPTVLTLPWYAFDGHTRLGGIALGSIAKKKGIDREMIRGLMFHVESIRLGPAEAPSRWKGEALEFAAQQSGWVTHAQGVALWESIAHDVEGLVEWLKRKEGL